MTEQPMEGSDAADGHTPDRAHRWRQMLDLLAERGRLSVGETANALAVSEATVRRDFTELARQQLVTRTHGGVLATSVAYDLPARYRSSSEHDPKERIAAAAADMVEPGMVVGFNGGTTTSATARRLASRIEHGPQSGDPALTVVTNALNIATEMVLRPHIRTVSLGGVARPQSYEMTGPLATLVLNELWLDLLILGVDGLSAGGGASCRHVGEAGINALMVQRADRVVIVGGGEKIGQRAFARICDVDRVTVLVTDPGAPDDDVTALESAGVDVRVV
ncbi:DeoR family transcriptional regulator [Haloactinopolyspora alba]|uniref:DeoR family transcriptional regulator n=1 Tax=Haloactinopolyspora alba TaxID=648780 RepID=A0A2P8DM40_9ACTN|nr:DeoR/GlpR family DNA-binding transcription regulator [Haloactinopolyspora alba]PSK98276.1 DeoR family transcriptional regulator [Haloactinopolyspora alba]